MDVPQEAASVPSVSLPKGMAVTVSSATARPTAPLRRWIGGYSANLLDGFQSGSHRALPSPAVVMVLSLADPINIAHVRAGRGSFTAVVAGPRTSAGLIAHQGRAFDLSLEMSPAAVRTILGVPASVLSESFVDLRDLWGTRAVEIVDRLAAASSWRDRFGVLDEMLINGVDDSDQPLDTLEIAWRTLVSRGGLMSISDLASEVGYSRRHLHHRFVSEYGISPKQASRLVRFQKSVGQLRDSERRRRTGMTDDVSRTLSDIAASTGFYDQAHMTREWNELAGCSPSKWLADEELPFVQDAAAGA